MFSTSRFVPLALGLDLTCFVIYHLSSIVRHLSLTGGFNRLEVMIFVTWGGPNCPFRCSYSWHKAKNIDWWRWCQQGGAHWKAGRGDFQQWFALTKEKGDLKQQGPIELWGPLVLNHPPNWGGWFKTSKIFLNKDDIYIMMKCVFMCMCVTKNHHFPLLSWALEARSEQPARPCRP